MDTFVGAMMNLNVTDKYYLGLGYYYSAGYFAFKKSYENPMRYSLCYPHTS